VKETLGFVATMALIFYGLIAWADSMERSKCRKIGEHTGMETRYPDELNFDEGCFVKTKSGWVPLKNWRAE
jgi:hypothetical protein